MSHVTSSRYGVENRVTYHSDIFKQRLLKILYGPIMHAFLNRVGRIAVTSPNYLETSTDLARHRSRCQVIPLGLDEESYARPSVRTVSSWEERVGRDFAVHDRVDIIFRLNVNTYQNQETLQMNVLDILK